ncbi:TonB-dependent siderophore receptor [Acaryochloris sp. CCMEE 5410]|uniref:TonB-dependent siderophore receptor n=1 Tax=Acaryochloris sp. CCMEE 5410 TaxID=310037 RepID=UPI000585420C|nr:TonB-dependent siderophore receptor [Acaryochloris sp. CCMEE 5410]KAI9135051.1 TonB-dependent siderophore receptor [Acaryochloris sp. CCMEE 5410]
MSKRYRRLTQKAMLPELLAYGLPSVIATLGLLASIPVRAEQAAGVPEIPDIDLAKLSTPPSSQPATSVKEWQAQIEASIVEITAVRVEPSPEGLNIILESETGQLSIPTPTTEGNRLSSVIPNAVLALPEGPSFEQANPTPEITQISVTNLADDQVKVVIIGAKAAPTATVSNVDSGLTFSIAATPDTLAEDEEVEITVTANPEEGYAPSTASVGTRTDSPIRDVPQSIQVIPKQIIEDQQAIGVEEVVENVGGVTFLGNQDSRGLNFSIRGFDNVPVLQNGFRLFGGDSVEPEVANLERVEVLKGPASILFGQSEPGGLINLIRKKPLSEPFYKLQIQGGNRGFVSPSVDLSGPLDKDGNLLYRLNALYRREDSFRDYTSSFDRFFVGPSLTWNISDQTDVTFSLEYIKEDNPADFGTLAFGDGIANIPLSQVTNNPDDTVDKTFLKVGYNLEHRFNDKWKLRNEFSYIYDKYDYGVLALPFSLDEPTGTLTRVFAAQFNENTFFNLNTSLQGEFETGSIRHNVVAGVDLSRADNNGATRFSPTPEFLSFLDIFNPVYDPKPPFDTVPIAFGNDNSVNRLGVYLQDQIYLLDNLILVGGIRYDIVDRSNISIVTGIEETQVDEAFSPRVGLVFQPTDYLALYANYSKSFNPTFERDDTGEILDAERGEGFEVGIKAELIKDRLSATLAFFDITKSNVATADPVIPFASVTTGEQNSRGIDFDISGEILPGWNVIASYAYIDAKVTQDNTFPIGNDLSGVPEHSASLWTSYEIQSGDAQGLGFGLGFNFVDDRAGDLENSFRADSYFLTNAAIFYRRDKWDFRINIDNLFDVNFIRSVDGGRARGIYPGEPFTIRGSISVEL